LDTVFSLKNGQCVAVTSMELKLKEIEDAVPVVREVAFRTPTIRFESTPCLPGCNPPKGLQILHGTVRTGGTRRFSLTKACAEKVP